MLKGTVIFGGIDIRAIDVARCCAYIKTNNPHTAYELVSQQNRFRISAATETMRPNSMNNFGWSRPRAREDAFKKKSRELGQDGEDAFINRREQLVRWQFINVGVSFTS